MTRYWLGSQAAAHPGHRTRASIRIRSREPRAAHWERADLSRWATGSGGRCRQVPAARCLRGARLPGARCRCAGRPWRAGCRLSAPGGTAAVPKTSMSGAGAGSFSAVRRSSVTLQSAGTSGSAVGTGSGGTGIGAGSSRPRERRVDERQGWYVRLDRGRGVRDRGLGRRRVRCRRVGRNWCRGRSIRGRQRGPGIGDRRRWIRGGSRVRHGRVRGRRGRRAGINRRGGRCRVGDRRGHRVRGRRAGRRGRGLGGGFGGRRCSRRHGGVRGGRGSRQCRGFGFRSRDGHSGLGRGCRRSGTGGVRRQVPGGGRGWKTATTFPRA